MPSNFKVGGADLDSVFAPRAGSAPAANTGFKAGGVDLADRYHASTGGDTIAANTGYKAGGTDLRAIFRDIHAVPPSITGGSVMTPNYVWPAGDPMTIDVVASGSGLSYQWFKNGSPLAGATGTSITFTAIASGSDDYSVTVTNSVGSASRSTHVDVSDVLELTLGGPNNVTAGDFSNPDDKWRFTAHSSAGLSQVRFQVVDHGAGSWTPYSGSDYDATAYWADPFGFPSISFSPGTYTFYFEAEDVHHNHGYAVKTVVVH